MTVEAGSIRNCYFLTSLPARAARQLLRIIRNCLPSEIQCNAASRVRFNATLVALNLTSDAALL